jgi:hypothetical protein
MSPETIKRALGGSLVHLTGILRAWKFASSKKWGVALDVQNIQILRPAKYGKVPKQGKSWLRCITSLIISSVQVPHGIIGAMDSLQKAVSVGEVVV